MFPIVAQQVQVDMRFFSTKVKGHRLPMFEY
jgi:hypothetical protein